MATQEQMEQFGNSSSDDSSGDESSEELVPTIPKTSKLKLKLNLRLPKKEENDDEEKELEDETEDDEEDEPISSLKKPKRVKVKKKNPIVSKIKEEPKAEIVVSATVVDDDAEEDAATVVAEPIIQVTHHRTPSLQKKRQSVRPIKMPPIASPGLLLANGNTTAAQFDHHMKVAGYSLETRKKNPHRGSSTKREVGDMFDSDVILTNNFPELVPRALITDKELISTLNKSLNYPMNGKNRKRRFDEMIPISLQIDYPSDYVREQERYVKKVKAREAAIKEAQEAELEDKPPVKIPHIPSPPEPPKLIENQQGLDIKDDKKHPLYPPKNADFVKHLDSGCFHSSRGRYLGLSSNSLSDPHFTGAHAIGVQNLSVTAGTGLATTQTGSTSAGSASLASTVYGDRGPGKGESKQNGVGGGGKKDGSSKSKTGSKKKRSTASSAPASSGTAADLKKIMERKTQETTDMRKCIISAGVYASRTGLHGQSFVGPDGNTYPDVSKTFASYAGIKPCNRCKNNKQGAYHCRLRRRHKEKDHDGGDSPAILAPLFEAPLESLTLKRRKPSIKS